MTDALATRPDTLPAQLDPQALISKAIEAGAGIDTMERLFALAKEMRGVMAREAWYAAMAEFQEKCPAIKKTATARMKGYSYTFAPLDEICSTVQPVMGPLGLSMRWTTPTIEGDKVTVACVISHRLGHFESSGDVVMPVMAATQRSDGSGEGGANAAQRVGISLTYAKRYSLLGILGMAPEDDDDAAGAGQERGATTGAAQGGQSSHGQDLESVITENQLKRLMAIAGGKKWTDEQIHTLIAGYGYTSRKDVKVKDYEAICDKLKLDPPGKAA